MSVILNKFDDHYSSHGKPCSVCETKLHFPFVHWEQIRICASCCGQIMRGLVADMIQVSAAAELQRIYPDSTLVRRSVTQMEKEAQEEQDKIARLYPQYVRG
jgi:hypothetical protein